MLWASRLLAATAVAVCFGGSAPLSALSKLVGDLPRVGGQALEEIPGLDSEYGGLVTTDGARLRSIVTRPSGTRGKLPGLVFVQWLSCDTVELPAAAKGGWARMMRRVFADSGMVVHRLEKSGVGDSLGRPCPELDYETELRHHREALQAFRARSDVDGSRIFLFGASMGATMVPLLANEPGIAGVISWGGGARTWFERTLTFERRRREGDGMPGEQVTNELRAIEKLLGEYLLRSREPEDLLADPELGAAWRLLGGLDGNRQYGRPAAFHRQAQSQNWAGAWEKVDVPVLVLFGENDWFEDSAGSSWIAELVNRRRPGRASFRLVPGLDHHFERYPSLGAAVRGEGGVTDEAPAAGPILEFLRAHGASDPRR